MPLLTRMATSKQTCDELRAFYGGMMTPWIYNSTLSDMNRQQLEQR